MKNRFLLVATLAFTVVGFAQKNEIKDAEKALKDGDSASAKTSIEAASGSIASADEKLQAQYYFTRGKVYSDLAKKGDNDAFEKSANSFKKVLEIEEKSGKEKYTGDSRQYMASLTADLVNSAVADNGNNKFKEAAEKLYMSYTLSPQDTSYLYYAAGSAVNGGHYEMALDYYNKLQEVGYDGGGMVYKATNSETGEVEEMEKMQRDLMVKSGSYTNPLDERTPSKQAEIVKNTALIYTQLGQDDKALEAYKVARKNDPEDVNLILNEANLYFNQGDKDKFKELMAEAIALAPDNADLHYNVGVISMEQEDYESARASYKKAIEIDPKYTNAYLNLSTTYVNEGNALIDEMNSLGNSRADVAKYDELKEKKDSLFKQGADVLEEALKTSPENENIMTQLKNIYGAMGDNENFMRMKKMLGE
ncbi:MAG: tetratricopeptide repeat protein [Maribacter sp.]